ncbi:MAG: protein arginine kinase [Planctomycetes bacterium]|nr:protein arginine kinase [Planctomycetota bacterium]
MRLERDTGEWLKGSGPESDIVISSRIRLARNLQGYAFRTKLAPAARIALEQKLHEAIDAAGLPEKVRYSRLDEFPEVDRQYLLERHLISREHAGGEGARGVAVTASENISIMTLEEDHLRLQVLRSGLDLDACWTEIDRLDDRLEEHLTYAFDPELGYLTACPTNVGTGIRVSVMLHLPGLVLTQHIERMFRSIVRISLVVRGLYGEGTQASGDFFQVSNQVTLGQTERQIIDEFKQFVPRIIDYERKVREKLLTSDRERIEDRVSRACGTLRSARTISSAEAMEKLSLVRLGVNMGLIPDLEIGAVNSIFINAQPAHIIKRAGRAMDAEERDVARARYIQEEMGSN